MLVSILVALGLNFDTFSIAIVEGSQISKPSIRKSLEVGVFFGLGQAFMAFLGSLLGIGFKLVIINIDHWIAFILLSFIGGKLILDSKKKSEDVQQTHITNIKSIFLLVIATSIDALVIGITLVFIKGSIFFDILSIGIVTFIVSSFGFYFGNKLKKIFKNNVKVVGGLILVMIGIKILVQHIFFGG